MNGQASSPHTGFTQEPDGADDNSRTVRHPRWTRYETFVLLQGKNVIESQIQLGQRSASSTGTDQNGSKWESISSYCKQHGVNKEPMQCLKRWSNLFSGFKKIKAWELQKKDEAESYWIMRSDLRRQRKLPGFFDNEIYDMLHGKKSAIAAVPLRVLSVRTGTNDSDGDEAAAAAEEEENGSSEGNESTDSEQDSIQRESKQRSEKETSATENPRKAVNSPAPISGIMKEHPGSNVRTGFMTGEGWKRKRLPVDEHETPNQSSHLIKLLERNANMINAQLEAHNTNCQADRAQRKEHTDSLLTALGKLTDALQRIAEKL